MAIPTYDQFIYPLLEVLARHPAGLRSAEAYKELAALMNLSEEDKAELLPSGSQPVYQNRIGWAHDRLKRAGLSEGLRRGYWCITKKGKEFLARYPNGLNDASRRALMSVSATSSLKQLTPVDSSAPAEKAPTEETSESPEDRIASAIRELNESLEVELLELIGASSPRFFERLVLDVLHAVGYGGSRSDLVQTGGSGDGGIDGVISLDRLGLERVYIQAKRWAGTVGRPDIQGFFGALAGRRAKKGVFITTSAFTRDARAYAGSVSDSIVLIDGRQLAALMIEYGVGVSLQRSIRIGRVDSDYFEEL